MPIEQLRSVSFHSFVQDVGGSEGGTVETLCARHVEIGFVH